MNKLMLAVIGIRERTLVRAEDAVKRLARREEGQGTMEYVLIIALMVVAVLGILWAFRDKLTEWITAAAQKIGLWSTEAQKNVSL